MFENLGSFGSKHICVSLINKLHYPPTHTNRHTTTAVYAGAAPQHGHVKMWREQQGRDTSVWIWGKVSTTASPSAALLSLAK